MIGVLLFCAEQATLTRDYLNTLDQHGHRMPAGPVIISPQGLIPSLYREMVLKRPHEFKIKALQVRQPDGHGGRNSF